ncbi:MAG: hypothetical protein ABSD29_19490 [Verrucomicrobiota bacterium]|jgi:hypothetical protein
MTETVVTLAVCISLLVLSASGLAGGRGELRVGVAGHAFGHLGPIGEQAETAAASGANTVSD